MLLPSWVHSVVRGSGLCRYVSQSHPGSYTCSCRAGYTARSEGRVCVGTYLSLTRGAIRAPAEPGTQRGPRVESVSVRISVSPGVLYVLLPSWVHSVVRGSGLCRYVSQSHPGSYTCSCRAGYTARSEGRVCVGTYLSLTRGAIRAPAEPGTQRGPRVGSVSVRISGVLYVLLPSWVHSVVRGSGLCRYVSQSHPGCYTCSCRAGYTAWSEGRVCVGM